LLTFGATSAMGLPSIRPFEINHRKIFQFQATLRDIDEIRRLLPQPLDGSIDLRLGHFCVRQLERNPL
jgi:hypothetical protein